jgi:hypothetical protein
MSEGVPLARLQRAINPDHRAYPGPAWLLPPFRMLVGIEPWTVAVDGRYVVAAEGDLGAELHAVPPATRAAMASWLAPADPETSHDVAWAALLDWAGSVTWPPPQPPPCRVCGGTGLHACETCESEALHRCGACANAEVDEPLVPMSVLEPGQLFGTLVDRRLIGWLLDTVAPVAGPTLRLTPAPTPTSPLRFDGGGWRGVVMPLRAGSVADEGPVFVP